MAKDLQRAIDASVKASEAHTHLDQRMYMSAKHLESAAFFAKDLKRPDEAARLYEEAASFHQVRARASVSVSVSVRVRVRVSVSVRVRVRIRVRVRLTVRVSVSVRVRARARVRVRRSLRV